MNTSTKKVAILQSNYIPWKGYFDIIAAVDEFLIYDEAQFTRRDWRNRNRIMIQGKPVWLTIPVKSRGYFAPIDQIEIADPTWTEKHWRSIRSSYSNAEHWDAFSSMLEAQYQKAALLNHLTDVNEMFIRTICASLQIDTLILRARDIPREAETPTGRLAEICRARGASVYVSGPAAKAYIVEEDFAAAGIELKYANYSGYPTYPQFGAAFEHGVSIVDLLMHCGETSRTHLKSINRADFLEPATANDFGVRDAKT